MLEQINEAGNHHVTDFLCRASTVEDNKAYPNGKQKAVNAENKRRAGLGPRRTIRVGDAATWL